MPYRLIKQEGAARRGEFTTVHGTVQTPAFQNVATAAAIKGGLSALDLKDIRAQVMLCNTYHLHLRPGDKLVAEMGGLHKFTKWDGPILTDSGGFQVFSLAKLRHITEEGVTFNSHLDGHRIFMGPEQSMQIQANLGSTIAMAFDECVENPATYEYAKNSCARTARWLLRCKDEMNRLKHEEKAVNPDQLLFGINQGCTFEDLRVEHMKQIAEYDLDGYAIGGLAVGEPPVSRGYTPSIYAELPKLLERSGNFQKGSITGVYTVLVEGDDTNEPIADTVRGILDGHIVLSRKLANSSDFPAIDIGASISRLMADIVSDEHKRLAAKIRDVMGVYEKNSDLVSIGAYKAGTNPKLDYALSKIDGINDFLTQGVNEAFTYEQDLEIMRKLL